VSKTGHRSKPSARSRLPGAAGPIILRAGGKSWQKEKEASVAEETYRDVAVIGAGPVGLFAVFECGMLKMTCHVVDALDVVGGQCVALYPEKPIYDIPAYPEIAAATLIDRLAAQAAPFAPSFRLGHPVTAIERGEGGGFVLTAADGARLAARAVVIAAGVGAFGPNRPPLPGLAEFEGKSVFYLVRRREDFRDKRVVIAGGGDSAVDWAISLADIAERVMVIHRRAKFRAAPESAARLQRLADDGRIDLVIPYQLQGLEGSAGRLDHVVVADLAGAAKRLPADALLAFFGLAMDLGPIAQWGLNLERNHIAVDPSTCATSVPGIFAIGDIATYRNKLKLILSGFAEAATAAHAIYPLVHPGEALHFEYSTTKGLPGYS
jgi:thioredoxin reductase (NADPH)